MIPYYKDPLVTIYHGDCREIMPSLSAIDLCLADPTYEETSLKWDKRVDGWLPLVPCDQLWCFGSLRSFLATPFVGWRHVQEIVWEKHNGSGLNNDRFKRVHELTVHFARVGIAWADLYHAPVYTADATARTVRRKAKPTHHQGARGPSEYASQDGGPRLMRSVLYARSCHGEAVHPTQKPTAILCPLIEYSCPPDGLVLDPFAGSGSTLIAARQLQRRSTGIELDERYCEIAAERCRQATLDL